MLSCNTYEGPMRRCHACRRRPQKRASAPSVRTLIHLYGQDVDDAGRGKEKEMEISRILVPTDFSASAACAFYQALTLAAREHAHLFLLHVLSPLTILCPDMLWSIQAQLEEARQDEAE